MNRRVWKYSVKPRSARQSIEVPAGAVPVALHEQTGVLNMWVELDVDNAQSNVPMHYWILGTGWPVPDEAEHVATTMVGGGLFVWHLFKEVVEEDTQDDDS